MLRIHSASLIKNALTVFDGGRVLEMAPGHIFADSSIFSIDAQFPPGECRVERLSATSRTTHALAVGEIACRTSASG
jgi:hypothetical protein